MYLGRLTTLKHQRILVKMEIGMKNQISYIGESECYNYIEYNEPVIDITNQ